VVLGRERARAARHGRRARPRAERESRMRRGRALTCRTLENYAPGARTRRALRLRRTEGTSMRKYCKAYYLKDLRAFGSWQERPGVKDDAGAELNDDSIVYVQDNYVVTRDVDPDQDVLFDKDSPEWRAYLRDKLEFVIPDYALADDDEEPSTAQATAVASSEGAR
jgi:hypothetical protein